MNRPPGPLPLPTRDRPTAPGAGSFVYGVRTTGIFCRLGCPSRKPRPGNVVFFDSPREALVSGFRPCRRCRPEAPAPDLRSRRAIEQACRKLAGPAGASLGLAELARSVGYSEFHFQRVFTAALGVSPRAYREALRTQRFREELRGGSSVRKATYLAGRRSLSWPYSRAAGAGLAAGAYRRRGAGERVHFLFRASTLGRLLVGATPRGVAWVAFGDSDEELLARARAELGEAQWVRAVGPPWTTWADRIVASVSAGSVRLAEIPLDLRATAFQARVWHALREIPPGEVRSYSTVARDLGIPRAARAVARACAENPAALAIPCHRVVREDGSVGGYRWGTDRKVGLLAAEARSPRRRANDPTGSRRRG